MAPLGLSDKRFKIALSHIPLFIVGIVELVLGLIAYTFVGNINIGGFYCGLAAMITAGLSFTAANKCGQGWWLALSIITFIVALIALIVDAIAYGLVNDLEGCYNPISGSSGTNPTVNLYLPSICNVQPDECSCTNGEMNTCYYYTDGAGLDVADSCDPVLDDYPGVINNSVIGCVVVLLFSFGYSILACSSCCCIDLEEKEEGGAPAVAMAMDPKQQYMQQVQPQQQYVQQGQPQQQYVQQGQPQQQYVQQGQPQQQYVQQGQPQQQYVQQGQPQQQQQQ